MKPVELEPIIVEVRSRYLERVGFYRRSVVGGRQWTEEEIDRRATVYLSDLLRQAPVVRIQRRFGRVRAIGRGGPGCRMTIYVDGFRMGPTFNLDEIPSSAVGGLEVYQGMEVPIEYGYLSACGVILIWTRL